MVSSGTSREPEAQTFVVAIGDRALAASSSLETAKADAYARETKYSPADEYHWTEYRPGDWRLMSRREGFKRFSWTQYGVTAVPNLDAAAEGGSR